MRELHRRRISLAIEEVERRVKCSGCGAHNASIQPVFTDW
jgi:hypothetical protein